MTKFGAYLSIYNDWDILVPALKSIAPYIDELIVVDGAYEWMAPYVRAIGYDPAESDSHVYEAIESVGIRFRVISGVWQNEIQKRIAGYTACQQRYIFRVDADEVYFFYADALESFLARDDAVAMMDMPIYMCPGFIIAKDATSPIERQGFLFDSTKVNAAQHLSYLWLVLTVDRLPALQSPEPPVFGPSIAFNAHLTNWRTPVTSVNRAAFYTLNYFREHGAVWFRDLAGNPMADFSPLFERVSPRVFLEILKGSSIVVGCEPLRNRILRPAPLSVPDEQKFSFLYDDFLHGLALENLALTADGRHTLGKAHIDLSSDAALDALTRGTKLRFAYDSKVHAAKAAIRYFISEEPWESLISLAPRMEGNMISFELPVAAAAPLSWLRRILELEAWYEDGSTLNRFACLRD